jgi:hypothetical protein
VGWAFQADEVILLAGMAMVVHEEFFELLRKSFAEIALGFQIRPTVGVPLDGQDAVVAHKIFFRVALFALDHADDAALQDTAGEGRLVHKDENVERVAIGRPGGGDEAEVVRKRHSGGEDLLQFEDMIVGVQGKFVAAAFGSFDDYAQEVFMARDEGIEAGWIGEAFRFAFAQGVSSVLWMRERGERFVKIAARVVAGSGWDARGEEKQIPPCGRNDKLLSESSLRE